MIIIVEKVKAKRVSQERKKDRKEGREAGGAWLEILEPYDFVKYYSAEHTSS